jgi:hypothetical protein
MYKSFFRSLRRWVPAVLTTICTAMSLHGQQQEQAVVTFYHGRAGESRALSADWGGDTHNVLRGRFTSVLPAGSEVCVRVLNANPILYSYTLNAQVDTVTEKLPDVSSLVGIFNSLLLS